MRLRGSLTGVLGPAIAPPVSLLAVLEIGEPEPALRDAGGNDGPR
jgi:hypothetical protein